MTFVRLGASQARFLVGAAVALLLVVIGGGVNASGRLEEHLPNGCTRFTVHNRPKMGLDEVTLYCPDANGNLQQVHTPGDFVYSWLGRLPTDEIENHSLFYRLNNNFLYAAAEAQGNGPIRSEDIVYGHVGLTSDRQCSDLTRFCDGGGTYLYFPFCFAGECQDPDHVAPHIAVLYFNDNDFTTTANLVVSAPRGTGSRLCLQSGGYVTSAPSCLDRISPIPVASATDLGRLAVVIYRIAADWQNRKIDAALEFARRHYRCDYVTADKYLDGRPAGTEGQLVCQYIP